MFYALAHTEVRRLTGAHALSALPEAPVRRGSRTWRGSSR
jgi:hypothetical protein